MGDYYGAISWTYDDDLDREFEDELDALPTQIAYVLEAVEEKTTMVDLNALEEVEARTDDLHEAVQLEEHPGWGPRLAEDFVKTKFFARDDLLEQRSHSSLEKRSESHSRSFDTEPSPVLPRDRHEVTVTEIVKKSSMWSGMKRGKGVIIASLCAAAGVFFGTAVGLAANNDETRTPLPPVAVSLPAPALAPPVVELVPAEMEPVATREEPPALAEAVVEAPPEPEADPLEEAAEALHGGDLVLAAEALDRARVADADATVLGRLDAKIAVQRGDGAMALPRLRAFAESRGAAEDWVAVGQLLVQAERETQAARAFREAIAVDPDDTSAHLGLSGIAARGAEIGTARRHLSAAREAAGDAPEPELEARILAAEAGIALERGEMANALREAEEARALDARSSEASVLLARIAQMRNQDPAPHLRNALDGRAPAPVALGLLAPRVDGEESCELAERYLERAPQGFDARAMQRILRRCR